MGYRVVFILAVNDMVSGFVAPLLRRHKLRGPKLINILKRNVWNMSTKWKKNYYYSFFIRAIKEWLC